MVYCVNGHLSEGMTTCHGNLGPEGGGGGGGSVLSSDTPLNMALKVDSKSVHFQYFRYQQTIAERQSFLYLCCLWSYLRKEHGLAV